MRLIDKLIESVDTNASENAFCFDGTFYTYKDFKVAVLNIQAHLENEVIDEEKNVGLITNNDLETYAAIMALWLEGKAYVPINPETPLKRNINIIKESRINTLISSSEFNEFLDVNVINSKKSIKHRESLVCKSNSEDHLAYILFTSGTTGTPKGVPITHSNLNNFADAIESLNYNLLSSDRCLQMFDLTFDFSVVSYLIPLLKGACIYPVSKKGIKYFEIFKLLKTHELTVLPMVPSVIHFLRPYFDQIRAPFVKYAIFCGEALYSDLTQAWSKCIENATIINFYGPTEATVFCTFYTFNSDTVNKDHHGILSIGKPMECMETILVNKNNEEVPDGSEGELCVAGPQVTPGYWNNDDLNQKMFFNLFYNGKDNFFYKTGDLCYKDPYGDIMYLGRIDFQAKIQGHRIELAEIEFYSREFFENTNVIAVLFENKKGSKEIGLAVEGNPVKSDVINDHLKAYLPNYMIPGQIKFFKEFPLNNNGKTDRKKIIELFV